MHDHLLSRPRMDVGGGGPAGSTMRCSRNRAGMCTFSKRFPHPRFQSANHCCPNLCCNGWESSRKSKRLNTAPNWYYRHGRSQDVFHFSKALESQPYAFEVKRPNSMTFSEECDRQRRPLPRGVKAHRSISARPDLVGSRRGSRGPATNMGDPIRGGCQRPGHVSLRPVGGKHRSKKHSSAAVFGHFEGVSQSHRDG